MEIDDTHNSNPDDNRKKRRTDIDQNIACHLSLFNDSVQKMIDRKEEIPSLMKSIYKISREHSSDCRIIQGHQEKIQDKLIAIASEYHDHTGHDELEDIILLDELIDLLIENREEKGNSDSKKGDEYRIKDGEDVIVGNIVSADAIADEERCACEECEEDHFDIKVDNLAENLRRGCNRKRKNNPAILVVKDGFSSLDQGE